MVIGASENPLTHRNQFRLLAVKEFRLLESSLSGFAAVKLSEFLQISGILDPLHLVGLYIVQPVCACVLKPFAHVRILGSALDLQFSYVLDREPGLETRSGGGSEIP